MSSNEMQSIVSVPVVAEYEAPSYTRQLPVDRDTTSGGGSSSGAVGPELLLVAWKQWWKIALPTGLVLAAAIGAVVYWLYVPSFRATALIQIEDKPPFVAFADADPIRSGRYVQTQVEVLRSPIVLGTALSRPDVAGLEGIRKQSDPVSAVASNLSVAQVNKSDLYEVAFVSPSPTSAAKVTNAVIDEYLSLQQAEELAMTQAVIDVLAKERERRKAYVERLQTRLVELAKEVTGTDPFSGVVVDPQRAASPVAMGLHRELAEVSFEVEMTIAELAARSNNTSSVGAVAFDPTQAERDPRIITKEAEVRALRSRLEEIQRIARHPSGSSEYRAVRNELAEKEAELKALRAAVVGQLRTLALRTAQSTRLDRVADLQQKLEALQKRKRWLESELETNLSDIQQAGETSLELEFVRAELEREENVFELIAQRELALKTELSAPPRVRRRQAAQVPSRPIEELPYRQLALGSIAGLLAPFALALVWELRVKRIGSARQLEKESNLRVLGEVALLPVRPTGTRNLESLPRGLRYRIWLYLQSLDNLKMSLLLSGEQRSSQVFVVVSAAPGEGKTSVATGLGTGFGRMGQGRSLVIDADLRSPDVASALGVSEGPGLSDVLEGKCSLDDAILRIDNTDTYVLPAGAARRNAQDIVRSEQIEQLLNDLRTRFRFIVVDTAPTLAAAESLVFAKMADAVVLCALREVSIARQVRIATDRLDAVGANLVGAVLSGVPVRSYASRYGAYGEHLLESDT